VADLGFVKARIAGLATAADKKIWTDVFTHVLQTISFGEPTHETKAPNLNGYYYTSTTPTVANTEFSIAHGMGSRPRLAIPIVDVSQPGAQLVPLRVSRAADAKRVYFTSTSTSAVFTVLVAP
jgi:hypothetical protein